MKFIKLYLYGENETLFVSLSEINFVKVNPQSTVELILKNGKVYEIINPAPKYIEMQFIEFLEGENQVPEAEWIGHYQEK